MQWCSFDAFVIMVNTAWNNMSIDKCICNVFISLEKFISFINDGDGGNDLVVTKRGIEHKE